MARLRNRANSLTRSRRSAEAVPEHVGVAAGAVPEHEVVDHPAAAYATGARERDAAQADRRTGHEPQRDAAPEVVGADAGGVPEDVRIAVAVEVADEGVVEAAHVHRRARGEAA